MRPDETVEQTLRTEPINSTDFCAAMEMVKQYVTNDDPTPDEQKTFQTWRAALGGRSWTMTDVIFFTERFTSCALVALLCNQLDQRTISEYSGPLAAVKEYAVLHMSMCETCRVFFAIEQERWRKTAS